MTDEQLVELRAEIERKLAAVIAQAEELIGMLAAERRARADLNMMAPAHD
jgi:hypothetical protein